MKNLDLKKLYPILQQVQKPGRYVGGEYGSIEKSQERDLKIALCFPDLYEIGMSNQAVKLLYNYLNDIEGVSCERVYAVQQDMEALLKENDIPLYSLESFTPLKDFDILAFSIGYELSMTNIFQVLELGGIPLFSKDRGDDDPVVIAGGPAMTNPLPFAPFIDYVYMGEAEATMMTWITEAKDCYQGKRDRAALKEILNQVDPFWYSQKKEITPLVRWHEFGEQKGQSSGLPVPNVTVVQDQGVVEIMRGCPSKCRFCHAGVFYRPKREKRWDHIISEIDFLIGQCGYRNITLSSLSSGDFENIDELMKVLNERYSGMGVSFSLPSLRVNSISLELLSLVSVVRRSGLTFAVEAPTEEGQHGLNKDVSTKHIIDILLQAKQKGWKLAKFYFMVGLPMSPDNEADLIIEYLRDIQRQTKMQLHVNVGTFIPKSFTPYSRSKMLTEQQSLDRILYLKRNIGNKNIRISFHSPFASYLEASISRGDEQSGLIALEAYKKGARLDAWEEHLDRSLWKDIFTNYEDLETAICLDNKVQDRLDNIIDLAVKKEHFSEEYKRSSANKLTQPCSYPCKEHCGVCNKSLKVRVNSEKEYDLPSFKRTEKSISTWVIFRFRKMGKSIYLGHLDLMHIFERSFQRLDVPLTFSQGFNPKPKIEFANPLSLGISTNSDIFSAHIANSDDQTISKLEDFSSVLPEGIEIEEFKVLDFPGKVRLMKHYYSSIWGIHHEDKQSIEGIAKFIKDHDNISLVEYDDNSIALEIVQMSKSLNNPIKLLKEITQSDFPLSIGYTVIRKSMWAMDEEKNRITYMDLYK